MAIGVLNLVKIKKIPNFNNYDVLLHYGKILSQLTSVDIYTNGGFAFYEADTLEYPSLYFSLLGYTLCRRD